MINQNIDTLKITTALLDLIRSDDDNPRMSLLDLQIFLTINANPSSGKSDLLEIINGSTTSKSFLDRPIDRLVKYKLIEKLENNAVATRSGEARALYSVALKGLDLIKNCSLKRKK